MPRYTDGPAITSILSHRVPAVATAGNDLESALGIAPFDGYVSKVEYVPDAAYVGAATNYRSFRVRNKFGAGLGVTTLAQLDGINGVNLTAFASNVITLSAATPAAPAYAVQPTLTPTAAPVLSNGAGALAAGYYVVAYSYTINGVEGPLSPYAGINQGGANGITVAAVNLPPGVGQVNWYFLVSPGTVGLVTTRTTGASFTLNAQGNGTNPAGFSVGDVTAGDVLTFYSLHVGTGLADPGGLVRVTFTRG